MPKRERGGVNYDWRDVLHVIFFLKNERKKYHCKLVSQNVAETTEREFIRKEPGAVSINALSSMCSRNPCRFDPCNAHVFTTTRVLFLRVKSLDYTKLFLFPKLSNQ